MTTPRILVVEDEKAIAVALRGLLEKDGYEVQLVATASAAIASVSSVRYDLVLTDLSLGGKQDGMDVLAATKEVHRETPVVLVTAHGNETIAVQALKAGAEDYVAKPFDNDEMRHVVRRALERTRLQREHQALSERMEREYGLGALIGSGTEMRAVFDLITRVGPTDLTVLIRGESGTGKELVAQAIHQRSPRRSGPFVAVNCAAMSRELVESELFGHEQGAFTGANKRRIGRFESAEGGTLFLDEVGDMPLETQAKVLRVLEERVLERVGSSQSISVDVRIVAATHRDLEGAVKDDRWREDLFYRLNVVEAYVPPLRDRSFDIPALCDRFLEHLVSRSNTHPSLPTQMSPQALAALLAHPWPGNVRELRNVVERAAVLAKGEVIAQDDLVLGRTVPTKFDSLPFAEAKRHAIVNFERSYLVAALKRNDGNVTKTAREIGLARQSLQQKMRELAIGPNRQP